MTTMSLQGLIVKCRSCGGEFHETTEKFDPRLKLNGSMFRLLPKYGPKGHNWDSFPSDSAIRDADLVCPWCGSCYVGNAFFIDFNTKRYRTQDLAHIQEAVAEHEEPEEEAKETRAQGKKRGKKAPKQGIKK